MSNCQYGNYMERVFDIAGEMSNVIRRCALPPSAPLLPCPEGECCPICANATAPSSGGYCSFGVDAQRYSAGSRWHPYVPPHGFDRCATCECLVGEK